MSVNDMTVYQASKILNSAISQAQGVAAISANSGDFVSVATTALKNGYEPILNALSQMWSETIFSIRPYSRKFKGLEWNLDRWGNAIRKIKTVEKSVVDDARFLWPVGYDSSQTPPDGNGKSVDMYAISKPDILQLNFYGQAVYEYDYTIFRDNLDTAFRNADEFLRFNSMVGTNRTNSLEQYRETIARSLLVNFIASIIAEANTNRVVHLITDYNEETGSSLTATNVYNPDNFQSFTQWVAAKINIYAKFFNERSEMFQTVINNKHVVQHTPPENLRIYLLSDFAEKIKTMSRSNTYNKDLFTIADFESVAFWQSIQSPASISCNPTYTTATGTVTTKTGDSGAAGVSEDNVVGIMFDEDALGYAQVNTWSSLTPFNTKGGYWNSHDHANFKALMDMTEKAVVFILD